MAALMELSDATMIPSSLLLSNDSAGYACCDFFSANSSDQSVLEYSDHISFVNEGLFENTAMLCGGEMKRMKMDAGCRIGFRMKSAVEIMDDGFKWRKYGKKSVKNSPNPRNYYRCSSEGCAVKKRVERDPKDSNYVITTYEGVHNHTSPGDASYSRYRCTSTAPVTWSSLS